MNYIELLISDGIHNLKTIHVQFQCDFRKSGPLVFGLLYKDHILRFLQRTLFRVMPFCLYSI